MADADRAKRHVEIAHVLFLDIVGYSKRLIDEQTEAFQELIQIVRQTEAAREAESAGQFFVLPTGDGMALVFTSAANAPVECALQIHQALRAQPSLPVRMGIHSGPINRVTDINAHVNFTGAGINVAQRVMDCGDAGHILLSQRVADDLAQYRHWQPYLHDLGDIEVKHGVVISVVNLYADLVGNPKLPAKFARAAPARTRPGSPRSGAGRFAMVAAIVGAAVVAVGAWSYRVRSTPSVAVPVIPSPPTAAAPAKSIAVLPFENLSDDKANAYFADGMQDEILTRLSKIADLKVISRTSTQRYKSAPENLREIARQLGVANILEGSVQKAADAVHINVQLIHAATDEHLWAESYDRELKNIFGVEREIAETIAGQLKAKLLPGEAKELARLPTTNPEAYDLYLKAKYIDRQYWNAETDSVEPAIDLFRKAIALDPNFALAYAGLALAERRMSLGTGDHSPALLAEIEANAKRSVELQPDLKEGHILLAALSSEKHDDAKALAEYALLAKQWPNEPEVAIAIAKAKDAKGDWQAALNNYVRAVELDPVNSTYLRWLGDCYSGLGRHREAQHAYHKALKLSPEDLIAANNLAIELTLDGKLDEARDLITAVPDAGLKSSAKAMKYTQLQSIETLARNYGAALAASRKIPAVGNHLGTDYFFQVGDIEKNVSTAYAFLYQGNTAGARELLLIARAALEPQRTEQTNEAHFHGLAAAIAAGLGEHDQAIAEARQAMTLNPDLNILDLAQTYAHFGNADEAIPLLEKILRRPYSDIALSPALLRLDPAWDSIRKDPRFQKLCQEKKS